MKAIILLPGIEGSKLALSGVEFWPPTLNDVLHGCYPQKKIAMLRDPAAVATGIIDYAVIIPMYAQLDHDISTICSELGAKKIVRYYDWRIDIRENAKLLNETIKQAVSAGVTSIKLVCHSMGGLVGRSFLESDDQDFKPQVAKVEQFVGLCVPNYGAPAALSRAFGLEGSATICANDLKIILSDHRFPAGYQLVPAPRVQVLYDANGKYQDVFDRTVQNLYGLDSSNLDRAKDLHDVVNIKRRPANTEYFMMCGTGHKTDEKLVGSPIVSAVLLPPSK